jgi:hypothetical protein
MVSFRIGIYGAFEDFAGVSDAGEQENSRQ